MPDQITPEPATPEPMTPSRPVAPTQPLKPIATQPTLSPEELMARSERQAGEQAALDRAKQEALQRAAEAKNIFRRIQNRAIKKGSLITFQYGFYKHDFAPLCLVGKTWGPPHAGMISGVNLHYLTFRYIKYLVNMFCGKNFHYGLIKGDKYITNAYRSYKGEGRRQVKQIDCEYLNTVLKAARSFKPNEIEAIRTEVQKQLRGKLHPDAEQFAKEYQEAIHRQPHREYNIGKEQPPGQYNPINVQEPEEAK